MSRRQDCPGIGNRQLAPRLGMRGFFCHFTITLKAWSYVIPGWSKREWNERLRNPGDREKTTEITPKGWP